MSKKNPTNEKGLLVCQECGRAFNCLARHITTRHRMPLHEYRQRHGIDKGPLSSSESIKRKVRAAQERIDSNPAELRRLRNMGRKTQFIPEQP